MSFPSDFQENQYQNELKTQLRKSSSLEGQLLCSVHQSHKIDSPSKKILPPPLELISPSSQLQWLKKKKNPASFKKRILSTY